MKRHAVAAAVAAAALIAACEDQPVVAPPTTGTISLTVITQRDSGSPSSRMERAGPSRDARPDSLESAEKSAAERRDVGDLGDGSATPDGLQTDEGMGQTIPSPNLDIAGHLESARVQVLGPTNKTLDNLTPGTTVTVDGLSPGSYTVVLEGFVGGEVDYFGQTSGVQVQAGQNTSASISFNSFRPDLSGVSPATTAFNYRVNWPDVGDATGYEAEWDTDPSFGTARSAGSLTGSSFDVDVTALGLGTYYNRARASNQYVAAGRWSDAHAVTVQTDTSSGDSAATASSLGTGPSVDTTLTELNIFPASDQDWFAVEACQADSLIVETKAARLNPPSGLDTYLEVYESDGTTRIAENDDAFGTDDSFIEAEIPISGIYKIKVAGSGGTSTGHYEMAVEVIPGPANTTTACQPALSVTPAAVADTAQVGTTIPDTAELTVSGTSGLAWTATSTQSSSWLTLSATSGTTPSTLTLTLDPTGLVAGVYEDTVVVTSGVVVGSPDSTPVTFTITCSDVFEPNDSFVDASGLTLGAATSGTICSSTDEDYFSFSASTGQDITVTLTPPSSEDYHVSLYDPSQSLVTDLHTGGTTASRTRTATSTGTHYVRVYGFGSFDFSTTTPYTLTVTTDQLTVSPASVGQSAQEGSTTAKTADLTLSGTNPLAWTAATTKNSTWLSLSATSGTTPSTLTLTMDPTGLIAGTHEDTVVVVAPGAAGSPDSTPVTLTITTTGAIRVAGISSTSATGPTAQIFSSGDLAGSFTILSSTTFNAKSVGELRSEFDVLLFPSLSTSTVNADWTTRLAPYLAFGGGIIFEDDGNAGDLAPGVTATVITSFGATISTPVAGLTDGITTSITSSHMTFTAWDPALSPFLMSGTNVVGLYGQIGSGCIVLTGPDFDDHSIRGATGSAGNGYNFLLNAVQFVAIQCEPPPGASAATSTITASPTSIPADGASTSTITVQLKDTSGTDLTAGGDAVTLATTLGSLGGVTDNGNGTYTATLTAGMAIGTATITGTVNAASIADDALVTFTCASQAISMNSTVSGSLDASDCDAPNRTGSKADLYTFTGTAGQNVNIRMRSGAFDTFLNLIDTNGTTPLVNDNNCAFDGTNSCLLGQTLPSTGTYTIEATSFVPSATGAYTLILSATPSTSTSTIAASPTSIPADGASTSTVTVQLKDVAGTNLTTGAERVTLSTTLGSLSTVTDNADGTYTATLTAGTTTGTATVTGAVNGASFTDDATVTLFTQIRVAAIGANSGTRASSEIFNSGDLTGSVTLLDATTYNGMTPTALRASYDVLLFTYFSDTAVDADWNTRLVPYMNLGGGIIFEDPNNRSDLFLGVTGSSSGGSGTFTVTTVAGLTDGVTSDLGHAHMSFTAWDPALAPFITRGVTTVGLYGQVGTGCIVLTGPNPNLHGVRGSSTYTGNQYNLLLNEVRFAANGCS